MTKFRERTKAIQLRKEGKSYSEIKKVVNVSKSTLCLWLKNITLTEKQVLRISNKKEKAVERFRKTMRLKREKRLLSYYENQKKKCLPFTNKELFIAGMFLYWGEGNKASTHTISVSNTDPGVLTFILNWMINSLKIPRERIKVSLQLYSDMDEGKLIDFWSKTLRMPKGQFNKSYIKKTTRASIDQHGFGYGTCSVVAQSTVIKENLLMALKAISDSYARKRLI